MARKTTEAMMAMRYLTTTPQMRSVPGLCNFYQTVVPVFAKKAAPLIERLKKGQPAEIDLDKKECATVVESKASLTLPFCYAISGPTGQYTVNLDASDSLLEYFLLYDQDNKQIKAVSYCSRSLCNAKRNCDAKHKECSAVVCSALKLQRYQ